MRGIKNKFEGISNLLFYFSVLIFLLAFNFSDNPVGNWYQQFLPSLLNNRPLSDMIFTDSLTGFAITSFNANDTSFIVKSTNDGDNWFEVFRQPGGINGGFQRIRFINLNTGYVCGFNIWKTTNAGLNWFTINDPPTTSYWDDMSPFNEDTIWLAANSSLTGGVYFTSNGGLNWTQQFSGGNQNPNRIYMYNARIGFMSNSSAASPNIYRTMNGGQNWSLNLAGEYFYDMHFTDSLTGWKCMSSFDAADTSVKKTTNGGLTWIKQRLPTGIILTSQIVRFSFINSDTIWGTGGQVFYGGGRFRGILYRTTNGGNNWLFQIPDTSFGISGFGLIQFINKNIGWAYSTTRGIHTTNGGDTNWITGIQPTSNEVPKDFRLYQNYPNPFNSNTKFKVQSSKSANIKVTMYDITGRVVMVLADKRLNAGEYEITVDARNLSSGVYFYSLIAGSLLIGVKKMILLK